MDLQDFNFIIKYRPGKANSKADILSRRAGHEKGEKDNQGVILLGDHLFVRLHDDNQALEDLLEKIKTINKRQWEEVVKKNIAKKEPDWRLQEGLVTWKNRVYVPTNEEIRGQMIEIHHSWGHLGIDKTLELMTRNYWWPGMKKDIQKYIAGCNTCQMVKPDQQAKAAPLHPNEIPEGPWQIISVDMMGPLPESKGFDTILVVVD